MLAYGVNVVVINILSLFHSNNNSFGMIFANLYFDSQCKIEATQLANTATQSCSVSILSLH